MGRRKLPTNEGLCSTDDCDRPIRCRGLCDRCYGRVNYAEHGRQRRGCVAKKTEIGDVRMNPAGYLLEKWGKGGRDWSLQHRLVMAGVIGRPLLPEETVHHKNGDKTDNTPSNLELWSSRHPKGQRVEDLLQFAADIIDLYGKAA